MMWLNRTFTNCHLPVFADHNFLCCHCFYPIKIENFLNCFEREAYECMSAKMSSRKYLSGTQKRITQQRREHFNAKLQKISSIFLLNDWQGLSGKIKKHKSSQAHISACVTYDMWKNDLTTDARLDSEYKRQAHFWTQVLTRITDVTLTLASCNLSFRAHNENLNDPNNGNF